MRKLAVAVVILGMAALAFIAIDAVQSAISGVSAHATARENGQAFFRLIVWATFVGVIALATLASALGDVVMSRHDRNPVVSPRAPNGETAAMIDAEVNEGGPPSPVPCDTPCESKTCHEEHAFMTDESLPIETCPAPDRILHLPLGKAVGAAKSTTLMKSDGLELIRLVIPAGKEIPPHRGPGEITVQCIEGHVSFEHDGHASDLHAGDLLHLCPQEIHALKGIVDSSVLVTRLRPHANELPENFPAR